MRAGSTEGPASAGVSRVFAAFADLDWAAVENSRHDTGTDLWAFARDRRFELGLALGVQVKSGKHWFREPKRNREGLVTGWWFRDRDRRHFDYWSTHAIPHILVLHDPEQNLSYWAHVTSEAVVPAGTKGGAKMFVPRAQTIEGATAGPDLVAVAATIRAGISLEGSAWTGLKPPRERDSLRFAMLVPRLMAPHPNQGKSAPIGPAEALALIMRGRVGDVHAFAERFDRVPLFAEMDKHPDWHWRLISAFWKLVSADDPSALEGLETQAPDPSSKAACNAALANWWIETGQHERAANALSSVLKQDEMPPEDDAWLRVQLARALAEKGQPHEASIQGASAFASLAAFPDDVSATALRGAAASLARLRDEWSFDDLVRSMAGNDTAATWWRSQTVLSGLIAGAHKDARAWREQPRIPRGAGDKAEASLRLAALSAGLLGHRGSWNQITELLALDQLRDCEPDEVGEIASQVRRLRRSGSEKTLREVLARLDSFGPSHAIHVAGEGFDLARMSRSTALADLAFVEVGGEYLDEDHATRCAAWIERALTDTTQLTRFTTGHSYSAVARLAEALAGLSHAAPHEVQRILLRGVTASADMGWHEVRAWANVIDALPTDIWDADAASRLWAGARGHDRAAIELASLRVARAFLPGLDEVILEKARARDLGALELACDQALLTSTEAAEKLVERLTPSRTALLKRHVNGAPHVADWLTSILADAPDETMYEQLAEYTSAPEVPFGLKKRILRAALFSETADGAHLAQRLAQLIRALPQFDDNDFHWEATFGGPDVEAELLVADTRAAGSDDAIAHALVSLQHGSGNARKWAARLAAEYPAIGTGVLVGLSSDPSPGVRTVAVAGLLQTQTSTGASSALVRAALARAVDDAGSYVPFAVARRLASADLPLDLLNLLRSRCSRHPSAVVRHAARAG